MRCVGPEGLSSGCFFFGIEIEADAIDAKSTPADTLDPDRQCANFGHNVISEHRQLGEIGIQDVIVADYSRRIVITIEGIFRECGIPLGSSAADPDHAHPSRGEARAEIGGVSVIIDRRADPEHALFNADSIYALGVAAAADSRAERRYAPILLGAGCPLPIDAALCPYHRHA